MIIQLDTEDFTDINIMHVDGQEFNTWARFMVPSKKITDGGNFQTMIFQIGKVGFTLFYKKELCKMCKVEYQEDYSVDICASCYEEVEEENQRDRARAKREDAYDASRGH